MWFCPQHHIIILVKLYVKVNTDLAKNIFKKLLTICENNDIIISAFESFIQMFAEMLELADRLD